MPCGYRHCNNFQIIVGHGFSRAVRNQIGFTGCGKSPLVCHSERSEESLLFSAACLAAGLLRIELSHAIFSLLGSDAKLHEKAAGFIAGGKI
jgi:hypothetical protein